MSKVIVTRSLLDLLADSVSAKSGESLPLTIGEMKVAIDGIVLNSQIIGDGNLDIDENDYLYFDDDGTGIVPTGTITITANGTYNVTQYASAEVNISGSAVQTQTKTATPTESQQTISPDSGYLLSSVTVNAISSTYVGSGITQRSVSDITVSGSTVNIPYGYYEEGSLVSVSSITHVKPTISVDTTTGLITATHFQSQSGYLDSGTTTATEQLSTQSGTTITPTESSQVVVAANKYTLGDVKVGAISSTYVGSGITSMSSTDLIVSGATVTTPAGYYAESASKSVASGTAGTPTATKGTVSNHQVSITPSVTNTTGYITGGTNNGTAVTVTAAELASGNKEITSNGTDIDVVGYSTVSVAVPEASLQAKTGINPTTSSQTITADSGYDGLSSVQINAMPSGTASTPATTITANPSISINSTGLITATTSASQNITPSVSEGYVSSGTSGTVTVSGSNTQQLTTQAAKTVTPTESEQTAVAANVYTTGIVKVGAISSTYVGSGITQRDDTDLTVSGATVTVPSGYYASDETKSVTSGSASTPATTITANPSITVSSSGLITATTSTSQNITPTVSAGYVSSGTAGTVTVSGSNTEQLTTKGATTYNTSTTDQTIASGTYLTGTQTIKGVTVSGLDASKILSGTTVMIGDANDSDRIASVSGTLTFSTVTVSSSAPSGGSSGDIWIQT